MARLNRRRLSLSALARGLAAGAAIAAMASCTVTEVNPVAPDAAGPQTPSAEREPFEIPIDRSAVAAVVNSRVVLATRSLGEIPFDGQVLPVISPNGRYLATQTGEAPDWPTLLGTRGQSVSVRTEVEAYDLTTRPPTRIRWALPLPAGCLLGRSADDAGFLIERILADATRRIGKVSWATGAVTWLSAEGDHAIGATLTPPGSIASLLMTLREPGEDQRRMLVRGSGGVDIRAEPDTSYHMPAASSDPALASAVAQSDGGSDLLAIRMDSGSGGGAPRSLILARHPISDEATPLIAYQTMSPLQTPLPLPPGAGSDQPPGLLFFHPSAGRMAVFEVSTGAVILLADRSIAGAWHVRRTSGGDPVWSLFLTTPEGLKHQTLIRSGRAIEASPAASVSEEVWVPRSTTDAVRPYILIGPSSRDARSLMLVEMRPVDPPR